LKSGEKFNPQKAISLGRALVALRKSVGLTLKELSAACGVTASNLSHYEIGRQRPRYDTLQRILGAMEVPSAALHQAERQVEGAPASPYPKPERPDEQPFGWRRKPARRCAQLPSVLGAPTTPSWSWRSRRQSFHEVVGHYLNEV
jgi:transcriptional regulator with XRE-family HTH domain